MTSNPRVLAVSVRHRLAGRDIVTPDDLDDVSLTGTAPGYWRRGFSPVHTPKPGLVATTLQEALSLIAADRGAMMLCAPTASYHRRPDIAFVPVAGVPNSERAMVWRAEDENRLVAAFTRTAAGCPARSISPNPTLAG